MQVFRSKKDWWVIAFLVCMSGLLVQLLLTMQAKGTMQQYPVHTVVYMLTIVVLWWPVWSTKYSIDSQKLRIQSLFLTWVIPVENIINVSQTNNSVASPALSLDRLKIDYVQEGKAKFILLSPKNQTEFCQALNQTLQR